VIKFFKASDGDHRWPNCCGDFNVVVISTQCLLNWLDRQGVGGATAIAATDEDIIDTATPAPRNFGFTLREFISLHTEALILGTDNQQGGIFGTFKEKAEVAVLGDLHLMVGCVRDKPGTAGITLGTTGGPFERRGFGAIHGDGLSHGGAGEVAIAGDGQRRDRAHDRGQTREFVQREFHREFVHSRSPPEGLSKAIWLGQADTCDRACDRV
jgi:hypothetical protein